MNKFIETYEVIEEKSKRNIRYFFISEGKINIIKAIEYSFVHTSNGMSVYNLGFGNYNFEEDAIVDDVNSNNGDAYKVFNTVLNTIPAFFKMYGHSILIVQGSDSKPEFIEKCRKSCTKNCKKECRNFSRRISVYRNYVDKNYDELNIDFRFFGGDEKMNVEDYICGKKYDVVFLMKRTI